MNKNIKLAVAGAVLALSASAANAGIIIPAGDWTLDINGNVNAFASYTHSKDSNVVAGGLASARIQGDQNGDKQIGINTGLLPSWLGFTGTTRQNDVDVSFTISMQPNVSDNSSTGDQATPLFRQSFLTFGDKSWGSFKLGKDIGIFASDAILNDMTLLGVGGAAGLSGTATTLGGIGSGYMYAGWKGQFTYTTPNFNGLQASVGIINPNHVANDNVSGTGTAAAGTNVAQRQDRFGLEAKASYAFAQDNFSGKVWVGGLTYDVSTAAQASYTATAGDIGANINSNGFGLTGYYYSGSGIGTTTFGNGATTVAPDTLTAATANANKRDSDGGYVQLTYVTPVKTKVGIAYGVSNLDMASGETAAANTNVKSNERWTIGAYHPLTKHLNLVAEFNQMSSENHRGQTNESNTYSAGGILFF
jgi:predicted porin